MFGSIGIMELVIIAGVALMILGPEKFPEFAKMGARFVRDIRRYANEVQTEITKEIKPVTKELEGLGKVDPEKYIDSLIEDDEEDDGTINPEPEFEDLGIPSPEQAPEEGLPESTESTGQSVPYDDYPQEEDGMDAPAPETPERLDG